MSEELISCPFCKEDGFDLYGMKVHLTGVGLLFSCGCEKFNDLNDFEEAEQTR